MEPKKEITPTQALERLCYACAQRETCSSSVRQKLWLWGIANDEIERIMLHLLGHKYIDDARYAHAFVSEKSRLAKWGTSKIKLHLQSKRIAPDIIQQALADIDQDEALGHLEQILRKKLSQITYENSYEAYGKLVRFGVSRGYAYEQVSATAKRLCHPPEE